jgi:ATP-dependent Zn protease
MGFAARVPPRDWTRTIFLRSSDEDYTLTTRGRLLERIRVTLAGRAAEEALLPGGPTTYSHGDLKVGYSRASCYTVAMLTHT